MKKIDEGVTAQNPAQQLDRLVQPKSIRDALYEAFGKDWDILRRIGEAKDGEVWSIKVSLNLEVSTEVAKIARAEFLKKLPPA